MAASSVLRIRVLLFGVYIRARDCGNFRQPSHEPTLYQPETLPYINPKLPFKGTGALLFGGPRIWNSHMVLARLGTQSIACFHLLKL